MVPFVLYGFLQFTLLRDDYTLMTTLYTLSNRSIEYLISLKLTEVNGFRPRKTSR